MGNAIPAYSTLVFDVELLNILVRVRYMQAWNSAEACVQNRKAPVAAAAADAPKAAAGGAVDSFNAQKLVDVRMTESCPTSLKLMRL